jgi:tetratricopeptide (TPR) repeat protein
MRACFALLFFLNTLAAASTNTLDWTVVSMAIEVGDYQAAEKLLQESPTESAAAFTLAGLIHSKRREYPQAETAFREAMRREPQNSLHAWNLGEFLYLTGQWSAAVEAYDQVSPTLPQHPFAEYKTILALLRSGKRTDAWERIAPLRMEETNPLFLFAHAAWHASDGRLNEGLWFAQSAASIYQSGGVRLFDQPLRDAGWLPPE